MVSRRHPMTMENLPNEVLTDIFIRLLAKQLTQMRCICKTWNALLSHSSFIKSHLHRSIHKNDEILLFLDWNLSFDINSFTARLSHSPCLELTNLIKVPVIPQHESSYSYGEVFGSVNGLICFSNETVNDDVIYIWNPSLSAMLTLPPSSFPSHQFLVGFGFDPETDDYKVVKEDEVYSMRKGSWDLISQKFPRVITGLSGQNIVCVDGVVGHLHWLGTTCSEEEKIVGFDLSAETFSEIPLPDSLLHHDRYHRYTVLGGLAGKLCVMSKVRDGECEVWMMDEFGVADSWVKLHAFSQFSGAICPYGFTSRGEFLFYVNKVNKDDRFGLYDPVAALTKTFRIKGGEVGISKVAEYVDSLVWVAPVKRDRGSFNIE